MPPLLLGSNCSGLGGSFCFDALLVEVFLGVTEELRKGEVGEEEVAEAVGAADSGEKQLQVGHLCNYYGSKKSEGV